jgi:hypothetical protein
MIRIIAKLFAVAFALSFFPAVAPLSAAPVIYISSTGNDANPCTAALPCSTIDGSGQLDNGGQINCLNSPGMILSNFQTFNSFTLDCAGVYETSAAGAGALKLFSTQVVKIRNLTISGAAGGWPAIKVTGSGTLIIENCVFENMAGTELDIEPSGALNLVIKNSRISNGSTVAIVLSPSSGGSISATFDHVTVTKNGGGGIRLDTTNGPVTADVTDSVITNNTGNGLSAQGGAAAWRCSAFTTASSPKMGRPALMPPAQTGPPWST